MRNTVIKLSMVILSCIIILGLAVGCTKTGSSTPTPPANPEIIMASTTSTRDSGLFDILVPKFEQETGYTVKGIYVGSGAAIALGAQGEADILVVHSLPNEIPFMNDNNGINRQFLMHTDYLICGPKSDPAGIKGMTSAIDAFKKMAAAKVTFYSRGDNSGTDTTDKSIWKSAGVTVADGSPSNPSWYIEGGAGTGMGTLLGVASEKQAYVLTDRATFLNNKSMLDLDILVEGDPLLLNYYHVIQVNPVKFTKVNAEGAKAFEDWLLSKPTQDMIATYGIDRFGLPLFFADAGKTDPQPIVVTPTTAVALTVVNGATTNTYTLSAFKALATTVGSGTTKDKTGIIGDPATYVGVSLTDLITAVGGMKETQSVNVIASDGFSKTLTYAQIYQGTFNIFDKSGNAVTATTQPVVVLVYSKNGVKLDDATGPIEMVILTAVDQVSENSLWVKQVVKIEIVNP